MTFKDLRVLHFINNFPPSPRRPLRPGRPRAPGSPLPAGGSMGSPVELLYRIVECGPKKKNYQFAVIETIMII